MKSIQALLSTGESLVLATILSRSGSAPRAVGTRMIVRSDTSIVGTIGGGILEARVRDLAREVFTHKRPLVEKFILSAEDAGRMGMICGGQQEILLHFVDGSDPGSLEWYRTLARAVSLQKRSRLVTKIPAHGAGPGEVIQCLAGSDGTLIGPGEKDARIAGILPFVRSREPEILVYKGERFLVEPMRRKDTVTIFGAGHISQKLAPLATLVGFRTVVLDDRREFANRARFETADEIIVLHSFENAMQGLDLDHDSYIVIVTRGHAHDGALLAEALATKAENWGQVLQYDVSLCIVGAWLDRCALNIQGLSIM